MSVALTPQEILKTLLDRATSTLDETLIEDVAIRNRISYVCKCLRNRAGVRLLMSAVLAKVHHPNVDPRKPYTEIGGNDSFSGRTYDERYLTKFITDLRLPVNSTTAYLTPTLRNINRPLTTDRELVGRPRELYSQTLLLLDDVAQNRISAEDVLTETIRVLLNLRDEKLKRMASLIESLERTEDALPLSSEAIVTLVTQHLKCKNASRLPVLVVAAAYTAVGERLAESVCPLEGHNAADKQTGSIGDVQICLVWDDAVVTAYEMKMKRVTVDDIDIAVAKIAKAPKRIDNFIFVTTEPIDRDVADYAATFYKVTGGTEIVILDCIDFLRHFLHLFHRLRTEFLNAYQALVLNEPDSAVSQTLKEAFLALRQSAESDA